LLRRTFFRLSLLVLTLVVIVGCSSNISGEKELFRRKTERYYAKVTMARVFQLEYFWNGTSVVITGTRAADTVFSCTYQLSENKTAWLKVGGSGIWCADFYTVP
jgi:hypothetical protein